MLQALHSLTIIIIQLELLWIQCSIFKSVFLLKGYLLEEQTKARWPYGNTQCQNHKRKKLKGKKNGNSNHHLF